MPKLAGTMKALVILNQLSGKTAQYAEQLSDFQDAGFRLVEFSRETNLEQVVQESVADGFDTVVAAGGDGTVNAVVNALMSVDIAKRPAMGILPLGTANDFASTLGISTDIKTAIGNVTSGNCIPIDVVRISTDGFERYYVNVAAGGNSQGNRTFKWLEKLTKSS